MPWLSVNQTWLARSNAVPTPVLLLEVQRGAMPGRPGASSPASAAARVPSSPRDGISFIADVPAMEGELTTKNTKHTKSGMLDSCVSWSVPSCPRDLVSLLALWVVRSSSSDQLAHLVLEEAGDDL